MAAKTKSAKSQKKLLAEENIVNQEIKSSLEIDKTLGDRVALFMTDVFGSIKFLFFCLLIFIVWIVFNLGLLPGLKPVDRFPFPALELGVCIFGVILSVSVLISQNRQGKLEKSRQQVEFEINVRAENEITKVLEMLHAIQKKMGINKTDAELEEMKETLDLKELHEKLKEENKAGL